MNAQSVFEKANQRRAAEAKFASESELVPGGYYTCAVVGGWQDVGTGLRFAGPKARVNPDTREIVGLLDLPEPVQIPTHRVCEWSSLRDVDKRAFPRSENPVRGQAELVEIPFDTPTLDELISGLLLALRTGTIRRVGDDEVAELFPDVWAARKEKYTLGASLDERLAKPAFAAMLDDLMQQRRTSLAHEAAARKKS